MANNNQPAAILTMYQRFVTCLTGGLPALIVLAALCPSTAAAQTVRMDPAEVAAVEQANATAVGGAGV